MHDFDFNYLWLWVFSLLIYKISCSVNTCGSWNFDLIYKTQLIIFLRKFSFKIIRLPAIWLLVAFKVLIHKNFVQFFCGQQNCDCWILMKRQSFFLDRVPAYKACILWYWYHMMLRWISFKLLGFLLIKCGSDFFNGGIWFWLQLLVVLKLLSCNYDIAMLYNRLWHWK